MGKLEFVKCCVDVNFQEDDGSTPIHLAAEHGHLEVSRMLLDHNAEVDAMHEHGYAPLLKGSASGNLDIVQLLLDNNANAHVQE